MTDRLSIKAKAVATDRMPASGARRESASPAPLAYVFMLAIAMADADLRRNDVA